MSAATVAIITENVVIGLAIAAAYLLLRQGGGLQVKTPPVPKRQPQDKADADAKAPDKPLRSAS